MCGILIYNLFGKRGCHCHWKTTPFGGNLQQQVYVEASVPGCLPAISCMKDSEGCTSKIILCPPFLPRLSISLKSVFMLPVQQLLGTSGGIAFREHSRRREESDRALLGSPPPRCRPHRQPGRVAQSDKCVSAVPALPETGRGLT